MEDTIPRNDKGQRHGLWKVYWGNGLLAMKGVFTNDKRTGVWLSHAYTDGELGAKYFFI
jgi:antitoxin component YwqK of YwqJK toxin-antitoxin module